MVKFIRFIGVVFLLLLATESKADNVQILDDTANDYILKYKQYICNSNQY